MVVEKAHEYTGLRVDVFLRNEIVGCSCVCQVEGVMGNGS